MRMFSRRSAGYLAVATGLVLTLTGPLSAQSQGQEVTSRDQKQLVESLRSGGYVIVVRHGATFSDQADTDPFNFDNLGKHWFDVKEGEASIFKPEDGKYRLVARVQMEDWPKLVAVK